MNNDEHFTIGQRQVWGGAQAFGISRADLRRHVSIVGQTGTGKTTLIRNLAIQLIEAGDALAVIDPHGDLADELLNHFPPSVTDRVVYFNPSDQDHPIGFNLMASADPQSRHRLASSLVAALRAIWPQNWGPRMEWILYCSAAALLECQNVSLLGIPRLLVDESYRNWVVRQVTDPIIRSFWLEEFEAWDNRFRNEAIQPLQNKLGQCIAAPVLRNILGQVANRIDARFIMDHGRIFIANLSRGQLGEDKSNLLGALLVAQFHLAAMSRADTPEHLRPDFVLICDEFANYANEIVARGLSELRKYRAGLVLATQFLSQVSEEVQQAIDGNCGTRISFRTGEADAAAMSRAFGGVFAPSAFTDLGNFELLVRKLNEGKASEPFRAMTDPPYGRRYGRQDNFIRRSRERYATPRAVVESRIHRWLRR